MNEENQLLNWILPLVSCDILCHFGNFLKTLLMNKFPKYYHFNFVFIGIFCIARFIWCNIVMDDWNSNEKNDLVSDNNCNIVSL